MVRRVFPSVFIDLNGLKSICCIFISACFNLCWTVMYLVVFHRPSLSCYAAGVRLDLCVFRAFGQGLFTLRCKRYSEKHTDFNMCLLLSFARMKYWEIYLLRMY